MHIGFWATAGGGGGAAGAMDLISTTILSSTATSVTFSSIDTTTYKHLQVRWTGRTNNAGTYSLNLTMNGVGGSSYAWHQLRGWNSSVSSQAQTSQGNINAGSLTGTDSATGVFNSGVIDFVDAFSTTNNKTVKLLAGNHQTNGNGYMVVLQSGVLLSTSAISSISLAVGTGSMVAGSRFSLYGIKG